MDTNTITKHALKELEWRQYEAWRQNQIRVPGRAFTGKRGLADIIGWNRQTGAMLLCEVKGKGDKLSEDQVTLLSKAKKDGADVFIATIENEKFVLKEYTL